jgi:uncharacterized membrane protein YphA (DoxX/SURF4 family)
MTDSATRSVPATTRLIRLAPYVMAWCLGLYLAGMYMNHGIQKFDPEGFWSPYFARKGLPDWFRVAVGVIETVGGALLIIPPFATYGALGVSAVMVGAAVLRASGGWWVDAAWVGAYTAGLLWIAWTFRKVRWRPALPAEPPTAP